MNNYLGKLIVIDGTDGAGKTTQLKLLTDRLKADGHQVEEVDFPQYNTKSAGLVEEYLSGKYGDSEMVSPYQASVFYAVDRYDAALKIKTWLEQGKIVLSNRYVSSSLGHQGGKIDNPLERKNFFNWLYELEYKIFNIPQPDLSLILYVDPKIAKELAKKRQREDWQGKTKDIHEEDLNHLQKAAQVFLEIADTFPDCQLIRCTRQEQILSRSDIHYLIYSQIKKLFKNISTKKAINWQAVGDILTYNKNLTNYRRDYFSKQSANNEKRSSITIEQKKSEIIKTEPQNNDEPNISSKINYLNFERLDSSAKSPERNHPDDAGLDLFANDYYSIPPYGQALISTGIRLEIPAGYVGLIWDKSGLADQGYTVMGGVIDSGYQGEIKIIFKNLSEDLLNIKPGQKIAQLLIQKIETPPLKEGRSNEKSDRGQKGFGSSGQW